jgi:hypothetical protein
MPQLTFPLAAAGLCLDVRVQLDSATLKSLQAAGQPLPNAIPATGLIDTGTDISGVAAPILQQLAIPVHSHRTTQGIGGKVPVRLFSVMLFLLDLSQPHLPWLVQPDLVVMELPPTMPVEVLIGLDVLLGCRLLLDGPARQFTLDF